MWIHLFKKKPKSILIVDDSKTVRTRLHQLVTTYLSQHNFKEGENYILDIFESVTEYKNKCRKKYDLAFIDWNIGGTNKEFGSTIIDSLEAGKACPNIHIYTGQEVLAIDILKYRLSKKIIIGFIFKDFSQNGDVAKIKNEINKTFKL